MLAAEALDQRIKCGVGANLPERRSGVGLHAPELVVQQRVLERGRGLRAAFSTQLARGGRTSDRLGQVPQLEFQGLAPALVLEGLGDVEVRVKANRLGRLVEWKIEHLFSFANLDAMTRLSAVRVQQRERGGESKERSRRGGFLGLFNRDAGQLALIVERAGDLDLRM